VNNKESSPWRWSSADLKMPITPTY